MRYFANPRRYSVSCSNPAGGRCLLHAEFEQGPRRVVEGEYFSRYSYLEEVSAEIAEAKIESGEWHLEWSHTAYLKSNRGAILAMMPGGAAGALAAVREHLDEAGESVDMAESALESAEDAAFDAIETLSGASDAVMEAVEEEMAEEDFHALKRVESDARVDSVEKGRVAAQASEDLESAKANLMEVRDSVGMDSEGEPKEEEPKSVPAEEFVSEPKTISESEDSEVLLNEGDDSDNSEDNSTPEGDIPDETEDSDEEEDSEEGELVLSIKGMGDFSQEDIRALSGVEGRKTLIVLAKEVEIPAKGKTVELAEAVITKAFSGL